MMTFTASPCGCSWKCWRSWNLPLHHKKGRPDSLPFIPLLTLILDPVRKASHRDSLCINHAIGCAWKLKDILIAKDKNTNMTKLAAPSRLLLAQLTTRLLDLAKEAAEDLSCEVKLTI